MPRDVVIPVVSLRTVGDAGPYNAHTAESVGTVLPDGPRENEEPPSIATDHPANGRPIRAVLIW